ncbi:MAG: hypothetical protein F6K16_31790, partial [Symploca sp. SIO2B6]|nr:hypothetical protein [Symploca sp. SIO2B6]
TAEGLRAWTNSDNKDESRLLHGKALQDGLAWIKDKKIDRNSIDYQFLGKSQTYSKQLFLKEAEAIAQNNYTECHQIIKQFQPSLKRYGDAVDSIFQEVGRWTGYSPDLFKIVVQILCKNNSKILTTEISEEIRKKCDAQIIQNWATNSASKHLYDIWNQVLREPRKDQVLALYRSILRQEDVTIDDRPDLMVLLRLGLITVKSENKKSHLIVLSKVYQFCFNQDWIDQELTRVADELLIINRYEVQRELSTQPLITTYVVKDRFDPSDRIYLAKQFSPEHYIKNSNLIQEIEKKFLAIVQVLGKVGAVEQIPNVNAAFPDGGKFYIIQDYIAGETLESEIKVGQPRSEDETITLLISILDILVQSHKQGLKHLNLHPGNLLRESDTNKIFLIDFAIFQTIATQVIKIDPTGNQLQMGTEGYTAPEQRGGEPNFQSDIYAVGMIGIQALTGKDPAKLPKDPETNSRVWRYQSVDQNIDTIDEHLTKILNQMIHSDKEQRYQKATDALDTLQTLKRNRENNQKRLQEKKWQQRLKQVFSIAVVVSLSWTSMSSFRRYQEWRYKQNLDACNRPIQLDSSNETTNLLSTKLVNLAAETESACTRVLNSDRPINDTDEVPFYLNRGRSRLAIWKNEMEIGNMNAASQVLEDALEDFEVASVSDGQSSFFNGLAQSLTLLPLQGEGNDNLTQNRYEAILQPTFEQAIAHYLNPLAPALEKVEIPVLMKLAFFLAPQNDYASENLGQAHQLFDQMDKWAAKENSTQSENLSSEHLELIYNRAILATRAGDEREAIALFTQILEATDLQSTATTENANEPSNASSGTNSNQIDQELLNQTHQSLGFTYFKLGLQDSVNIDKALNEFDAMTSITPIVDRYQEATDAADCENKENNAERAACWARLISTLSKEDPNDTLPLYPVYDCRENPVLAIAEQALIDRGLEPASTKLCR